MKRARELKAMHEPARGASSIDDLILAVADDSLTLARKLELARDALQLVHGGPADATLNADGGWCAGVAMSALAAIEEVKHG